MFRYFVVSAVVIVSLASALADSKFDAAKRYISRTESTPTELGSVLVQQRRVDGSTHETAYNAAAEIRFSRDVNPDGKISGAHWVNQGAGRKFTDK